MPEIKRIKFRLKSGLLSELQSDTIFGSFCWRMKEISGEDNLKSFLESFRKGEPVFTVTDGFLSNADDEIFFPNPQIPYKNTQKAESKKDRIKNFLSYKEEKKTSHIRLAGLNQILNGYEPETPTETNIPKYEDTLRTSVEIDRETMGAKKSRLFSYGPKFLKDGFINVFIKILNKAAYNEYECEKILKETFELGYGKKKSSGYGNIEIEGNIEQFKGFKEPEKFDGFLILSSYLPSKKDEIQDGFYDFHVKYSKLGEEYSSGMNPFKKPIILFKPGSIFKTKQDREFYGRTTKDEEITHQSGVIQNGIAFTLKIRITT